MAISFTGLHIPKTAQNQINLQSVIANDQIKNMAAKAFNVIDKKSGNADVFLKTYYIEANDPDTGRADNRFRLCVEDKAGEVLSEAYIADSEGFYSKSNPKSDFTASAMSALKNLADKMQNMRQGVNISGIFNKWA